jgi:glucuronoarabinoxylan endo-1,4-beta-xylanase
MQFASSLSTQPGLHRHPRCLRKTVPLRLLALAGGLILLAVPVPVQAVDATVSVATKKQVIDGFGASSAWSGAMSDKIFDGLYTDLGYSILRVRIEDAIGDNWKSGNFNSWASELSNGKKAIARKAIVFASPWSPPASMRESFTHATDKTNPFRLKASMYADYLAYLNAFVKYFKDGGVDLYAISLQNEPDYADGWCWWTAEEMLTFVKTYGAQITTKVMAPESFQFRKVMSDPILNDAAALEIVDIIGYHIYGTPVSGFAYPLFQQKAAPLGKKLWQTEHYVNEDDNIGTIMAIAKEIHDLMVTGNANAYVYWWIPHANGLTSNNGDLFKRAYVIGQYAKHIRPGYFRVEATATPATNVYVSAYSGEGKVVIVAVNSSSSAVSQKFNLEGATVSQFSTWQTSTSANMAAGTAASVSGNSFTFSLPAQSITTFMGTNTSDPGGSGGAGGSGGSPGSAGATGSGDTRSSGGATGGSLRRDAGLVGGESGGSSGRAGSSSRSENRDAGVSEGAVGSGGVVASGDGSSLSSSSPKGGEATGGQVSSSAGVSAIGGGQAGSGAAGEGGTSSQSASTAPHTEGNSDGCSCRLGRTADGPGALGLWIGLSALALLRRRRH